MDWLAEHRRLCKRNDPPQVAALGLFKALRNYVDPLMKEQKPGDDKRPIIVEALGDMLMYLASTKVEFQSAGELCHATAEESVANLATAFARVVRHQTRPSVSFAYAEVQAAMKLLCITEEEAAIASLKKL